MFNCRTVIICLILFIFLPLDFVYAADKEIKVLSMAYYPVKDCTVLTGKVSLTNTEFKDQSGQIYTGPIDGNVEEGNWGVYEDLNNAKFTLSNINKNVVGVSLYFWSS